MLDVHRVHSRAFRANGGRPKALVSVFWVVQHQPGVHFRGGHRIEFLGFRAVCPDFALSCSVPTWMSVPFILFVRISACAVGPCV